MMTYHIFQYYRFQIALAILAFLFLAENAEAQTTTKNYVKTTRYKKATAGTIGPITNGSTVDVSVIYLDDLGRPLQHIAYGQSGNGKDLITPIEYDGYGRQVKDFLPYERSGSASLNFAASAKSDVENFYNTSYFGYTSNPYSEKELEKSAFGRTLKEAAPGEAWKMGNGNEIKYDYQTNKNNEVYYFKVGNSTSQPVLQLESGNNGFYAAHQLYKTILKDENWKPANQKNGTKEIYKNKLGQVVLERHYLKIGSGGFSGSEKLDTYYVYDEYGNLTFTLPPKLSERIVSGGVLVGNRTQLLDALGFQYRHDHRNREVQKKIPGKNREYIAYDNLDRVIAMGPVPNPFLDGSGMGWLHTKYDAFDRVAYTLWVPGVVNETTRARLELPQTHLSETPNTSSTIDNISVYYSNQVTPRTGKLLSVYYYDDYRFPWAPSTFPNSILAQSVHYKRDTNKPKGLPTGSWTRVLENQQGARATTTYLLYDNKSRVIRQYEKNYLGGYTQLDSKYDFIGTTLQTQTTHKRTSNSEELSVFETFEYTQENRLLTHTHKINAEPTKYLSEYAYDAIGQPIANYIEGSSSPLQKIDYKYNIRGWLTDINNITNLATSGAPQDLFAFRINYDRVSTSNPLVRPMYNGNIAETSWRTSSDNIQRKYEYAYDDLNRLLGAYFNIPGTAVQGSYDEYLSYDSNGNILSLQRYGEREDATLPMLIDDLKYGYDEDDGSNKLLNVTDEETHPSGFNDGNKHTQTNLPDFVYDAAGNLTRDRNKKISAITYNHLNQPKKLTSDTGEITYLYDAEGNKVQKQVTENRQTQITDYLGGFQYLAGKLDFLPHAEGYVKAVHTGSTTEYHYVYHYTDHLGNIRLSYGRDPETNEVAILKESHYYPFGLQHRGYVGDHRVFEQVPPIGRVNLIPVRNYLDDSYRYTFGGKEEQPELGLNWIDHHARNYMPDLGRWMSPDPLAEEYSSWSPYNYVMNSPLRFIDPDGMQAILSNSSYINRYLNNEGLTLLQRSGFTPSIGSQGGANGEGGSNNNDSMNRPIPIGDYSRGSSKRTSTGVYPQNNEFYSGLGVVSWFGGTVAEGISRNSTYHAENFIAKYGDRFLCISVITHN